MSPGSVSIVRLPPDTVYFAGLSRTIAFQRVLSSAGPLKASSRLGPAEPPPTLSPVRVNESNAATGLPAPSLLKANMPIFAFAGSGAARPTGVHALPSVEYAPVTLVPSDVIRR